MNETKKSCDNCYFGVRGRYCPDDGTVCGELSMLHKWKTLEDDIHGVGVVEKVEKVDKTYTTGQMIGIKRDMVGEIYGNLEVISQFRKNKITYCVCKCDCGNAITLRQGNLTRNDRVHSCGCLTLQKRIKDKKTHGMYGTKPYRAWNHMISRCTNPNVPEYKNYGGRGIKVCDDWLRFETFWEDMKNGYEDNLTLDRIDVNKGYCKGNCRWISHLEQQSNKRNNRWISYNGETKTVSQWSRETGIHLRTITKRLDKGFPTELVLHIHFN